ncbi:hypothetical protein EfmAA290_16250 [Enterococcus faecium]|nr:hypothetical protein EfmAA290_16250 [Enterococcus faecium]
MNRKNPTIDINVMRPARSKTRYNKNAVFRFAISRKIKSTAIIMIVKFKNSTFFALLYKHRFSNSI